MRIDVWRGDSAELLRADRGRSSAELAEGVVRGRAFAAQRMAHGESGGALRDLRAACALDDEAEGLFLALAQSRDLSARAVTKVLRLTRTIADIDEAEHARGAHVAEAFGLRFGGGFSW